MLVLILNSLPPILKRASEIITYQGMSLEMVRRSTEADLSVPSFTTLVGWWVADRYRWHGPGVIPQRKTSRLKKFQDKWNSRKRRGRQKEALVLKFMFK